MVLFLNKCNKDKKIIIEEPKKNTDAFLTNLIKYKSKFSTKELNLNEWYLFKDSKTFEISLKSTIPLGIISTISPGIQTGCDKVNIAHIESYNLKNLKKGKGIFVLTEKEKSRLNLNLKELDYIKPFYKNSDIFKYGYSEKNNSWIIVTNRIRKIDNYPNTKNHLLQYKPILDNRYRNFALKNADKEGRWWCMYGYRPDTDFDNKKIVFPYRGNIPIFHYLDTPFYSAMDIYYITNLRNDFNYKYVLGILNSTLFKFYFEKNGKKKGKVIEFSMAPMKKLPIKITSKKCQKPFINLVNTILATTDYEDCAESPQKQAKAKSLEAEIDQLVYKLYGLTQDEIKIVESYKNG